MSVQDNARSAADKLRGERGMGIAHDAGEVTVRRDSAFERGQYRGTVGDTIVVRLPAWSRAANVIAVEQVDHFHAWEDARQGSEKLGELHPGKR